MRAYPPDEGVGVVLVCQHIDIVLIHNCVDVLNRNADRCCRLPGKAILIVGFIGKPFIVLVEGSEHIVLARRVF